MARRSTWIVVGVLAVIGLAAVIDALRSDGEPSAAPVANTASTTAEAPPAEPAAQPGEFGGVLYYTDTACELRAVRLPTLEELEAPNSAECRFALSPDGTQVSGAGTGWDPHSDARRGRLFRSNGVSIVVLTNAGPEGEPFRGTAPAWRPDGTLTYFAGGAVREWPNRDVIIPRAALLDAVMSHINAPARRAFVRTVRVVELAWLDAEHPVVAIHAFVPHAADIDGAAVFEGRRPTATVSALAPITAVWASPRGSYWAIEAGGLQLFDRSGTGLPLPQLTDPHAVAWSPDDSQMAVATRASVVIFPPGETGATRRLPLEASDLAWRGETGPTAILSTESAREWLADVGVSGRLFVTEPTCRLSALTVPTLEWEDEPVRERAPCRFTLGLDDEPLPESFAVQPQGDRTAVCHDQGTDVFDRRGVALFAYPNACAPAWTPDGRLTFVRDGELWIAPDGATIRRLITRSELRAMFGQEASLVEVAWLDDERVWAAVRMGDQTTIAAMTTSDLVYSPTFTARRVEGLKVSSSGMVAATTAQGVVFFDSGGRRALSFPGATAVAWAPDSLIAAVAGPRQLLFVAPISREVVAIPLPVEDL
ncbi:MAG: hypothetical protein ACRDNI_05785, partial [Gaiellaceae bacterium]